MIPKSSVEIDVKSNFWKFLKFLDKFMKERFVKILENLWKNAIRKVNLRTFLGYQFGVI